MKPWVWLAAAALALTLGASGPWPTPWRWDTTGERPKLTLLLGNDRIQKTLDLPAKATELVLVLKKYVLAEDAVRLEWRTGGQLWLAKGKKIPGGESTEVVPLPPGTLTLTVVSGSGKPLADLTLRRN